MNLRTPDNRWGPGKVHRLIKTSGGKYLDCRGPYHTNNYVGKETDDEVTCKRCLAK